MTAPYPLPQNYHWDADMRAYRDGWLDRRKGRGYGWAWEEWWEEGCERLRLAYWFGWAAGQRGAPARVGGAGDASGAAGVSGVGETL